MTFSTEDFAKALEQHDYQFQKGSVVRGTVYSHDSNGASIDIGGKSAAFLPLAEVSVRSVAESELPEVLPIGETRDVLIIRDQDEDGQVVVSIRQLELRKVWQRLSEMQAENQTIQVRVTGTNKGGVTVNAEGLRGFIPRSHLTEREKLDTLVGAVLTASFLEVDRDRNRVVLSQRQAAQTQTLSQLELGQLIEGTIVNLKPYGAFVEFGGTTGLLHINQISQAYIRSLPDMLTVGQPIKAVVVDIDEFKGRISLSTKVLEQHSGEILENWDAIMTEAETRAAKIENVSAERD